jgi:hypothetical protein
MPWPASIELAAGELPVGPDFRVAVSGEGGALVERAAGRFVARLARQTGLALPSPVAPADKPALAIRLHWHLTDDQGFRVESRRHPELQRMGSDGLFYTQQQVREIVAYAGERGICV